MEEIILVGDIVSMICNFVIVDSEQVDSIIVVKLEFGDNIYNFGWVDEGVVVKYDFEFINIGIVLLVISDVCFICGCMVVEWL